MPKSSARGARTSGDVEILGVTPHALWILVAGREHMLDFERFPWFRDATMRQITNVELRFGSHLRWPDLDVDLHVDSLDEPDRFPLVAKHRGKSRSGARS